MANRHVAYAAYFWRHKVAVYRAAWLLGVTRLGLVHDWSKLLPSEWAPYALSFYGPWKYADRPQWLKDAFDRAWLAHIHRNKHHPQHWVLRNDTEGGTFLKIPEPYVREMVADWMGAGMAIKGHGLAEAPAECRKWWDANKHKSGYTMHPTTFALVEQLLTGLEAQR